MPKGEGKKYQMNTKKRKTVYLQLVAMIDPVTPRADIVSNIVELAWLTGYPPPSKVIVDCDKFLAAFKSMIQADYGIMVKPITSRNTQANSILESVHQTKCHRQV